MCDSIPIKNNMFSINPTSRGLRQSNSQGMEADFDLEFIQTKNI